MDYLTRRMIRHMLVTTRAVGQTEKDFVLGRLIRTVRGHGDNDVFTQEDVNQLLDGNEELRQAVERYDWRAAMVQQDVDAIAYFCRHEPKRPELEPDQFA